MFYQYFVFNALFLHLSQRKLMHDLAILKLLRSCCLPKTNNKQHEASKKYTK